MLCCAKNQIKWKNGYKPPVRLMPSAEQRPGPYRLSLSNVANHLTKVSKMPLWDKCFSYIWDFSEPLVGVIKRPLTVLGSLRKWRREESVPKRQGEPEVSRLPLHHSLLFIFRLLIALKKGSLFWSWWFWGDLEPQEFPSKLCWTLLHMVLGWICGPCQGFLANTHLSLVVQLSQASQKRLYLALCSSLAEKGPWTELLVKGTISLPGPLLCSRVWKTLPWSGRRLNSGLALIICHLDILRSAPLAKFLHPAGWHMWKERFFCKMLKRTCGQIVSRSGDYQRSAKSGER